MRVQNNKNALIKGEDYKNNIVKKGRGNLSLPL
jgi:hypothetical protein